MGVIIEHGTHVGLDDVSFIADSLRDTYSIVAQTETAEGQISLEEDQTEQYTMNYTFLKSTILVLLSSGKKCVRSDFQIHHQ